MRESMRTGIPILIVDDDPRQRKTLTDILSVKGYLPVAVASGKEALEKHSSMQPRVALIDLKLGDIPGVDVMAAIKKRDPDTQCIIITGHATREAAIAAVNLGAYSFVVKPYDMEELLVSIERSVQLQESETRYRSYIDNAPSAVFVADKAGEYLDVNEAACRLTGYTRDELLQLGIRGLLCEEDTEKWGKRFAEIVSAGHASGELRIKRKDGSETWWLISAVGLPGERMMAFCTDITVRKRAEQETLRLLQRQTHINELSVELGNVLDIRAVYDTVYSHVRTLMDVKSFIVSFYDKEEQLLRAELAFFQEKPFDISTLPPIPLEKRGHGTQSEVIHTGAPLYVPDYRKTRENGTTEYNIDDEGTVRDGPPPEDAEDITRSAMYVPMKNEGETIGVMQVQSSRLDAYTQDDIDLIAGLANVAAVAVRNARLIETVEANAVKLQAALDATILVLGTTVETRDPYTAGHQRRVAELSCAIGEDMKLPAKRIEALHVAGLLHDIGKMSIPAEILSKPGRLAEMEYALIKAHPQVAYDILKEIEFPWPVADVVLQHHERVDGSGYPSGLTGDEILLAARIIGVADVVEAMSSHRPYRPTLGIDAALEEIKSKRGTCYDSDVVDACIRLFDARFSFSDGDAG